MCTQWITAWQTSDTTMNSIVKSTVRGERVVFIKQPNSQKASISAIDVKSVSIRVKGPILKVKLNTTGCAAELVPKRDCDDMESNMQPFPRRRLDAKERGA